MLHYQVNVRVLYRLPSNKPPRFVVSLNPQLISLSSCVELPKHLSLGTIVEGTRVQAVLPEWGVLVGLPKSEIVGFVHVGIMFNQKACLKATLALFPDFATL